MAILAALFALGSRFAGKILTTTLGWAGTLLFGRVPASRQKLLLGITFGSVIWVMLLIGVVVPAAGAMLLFLVPAQNVLPDAAIRGLMVVGALVLPAFIGGLLWALGSRETSVTGIAKTVLRGYPVTAVLSILLVFLAGLAVVRKVDSVRRGRTDSHVPMVVQPNGYEQVVGDLDRALSAAGLDVAPRAAPGSMSTPARWLARVAGRSGANALVPDQMIQLSGPDLDIFVYPMDVLISGRPRAVTRARSAIATRLTTSAAHLTITAEAQAIEDQIAAAASLDEETFADGAAAAFDAIDAALHRAEISYDEWETLYRQRVQVDRDLRATAMARGPALPLDELGRAVRGGAAAMLEVATDDRTAEAMAHAAGPTWRRVFQALSVGLALLAATRRRAASEAIDGEPASGEPIARPSDHT